MTIQLSETRLIMEVQEEFSMAYPYLKLEFYCMQLTDPELPMRKLLPNFLSLRAAGLREPGKLQLTDDMTVAEAEAYFQSRYRLNVQVSRRSGMVWLETKMTDKWTLKKQNEQGRDLSFVQQTYPVK